ILHFEYLLPYLRHMLMNSREARISFFGHDEFSPELIRRFNMNRAFGSMLFPNSLAGFLILSIPLAAALAIQAVLEFRRFCSIDTARPAAPKAPPYPALAWTACCWFVSALTLFGMAQFRVAYALEPLRWFEHDLALSLASCALAVAPAAFVFVVITRWGAGYAWRFFAALGLPLITVIELWTLWITYSRGAMLALLAAAMFAAVLAGLRLTRWGGGSLARAGTAFFLLGCGAHMLLQGGQYARAQEPAPAVPDGAPAAETSPDAPAEAPAPPPVANQRLREEGVDISAAELMNPESFRLRLSYWNVGLKMFLNHLWTGVGLGNFGIAYPIYQYVGAGDTKEAHSGFLQFFCETGIAGGLMFCVFWAIFLLAGALDLLRTPAGGGLLLKLGLYTGLLAFLLHAGIDIHFSHPSLVMFAVTFAALFMAGSGSTLFVLGPGKTKSLAVAVLMLMLVFNLVIAVFTLRPYLQDLGMSRTNLINVAGNQNQTKRLAAAELFLVQTPDYARSPEGKNAPQIAFQAAHTLIPDAEALAALGTLYTPLETGQGYRPLNPGEDPVNSVLMIQRPRDAYAKALESTQKRVAELEAVDACYGRSPELALHIAQWCKLITDRTNNAKYERIRKKYLDRMVEWGQQAVERNPMSAETHSFLGHLLWHHVNLDLGPGRMDKVRAAVTHFRRATELNPSVPDLKDQYARVLRELANTPSRELSDPAKAEYRRQADAVQLEADALRKQRAELGLP
ncbi:MAG: O-antigen ligase family protein, partial [Candidatus Hydrogenedentes bacterium]|nr:O-antigen ligase family protein [Candidatus Hydrogenedentota bacterium]